MAAMMKTLILISCIGTLLAGFLILFRPVTKRIFSSNWHYYMWLAVLITMLLPFKFNIPTPHSVTSATGEHIFIQDDRANATQAEGAVIESDVAVMTDTTHIPENETNAFAKSDFTYFFYIWIIGFAVIFFVKIIAYVAFLLKIRFKSQLINCPEIKNYTKRTVITRVSDDIRSPLMVGIFKPILLLPNASVTDEQLHYILEHETTHLKRYDILYKWFLSLVKAIHWFNPAIYIISRYINLDCEISCDMTVVKNLDATQTDGYVSTILSLLSVKNKTQHPLTTGMTGNKKILKKRFISIKKNAKIGKAAKIVSFILAFSIIVGAIYVSGLINGRISLNNDMLLDIKTDERQGKEFNFLMVGVDESGKADTILYTNNSMGFSINLPEAWKGKYEVIQFDNQVAFFHKDIFLKYGKGAGNLFRITKITLPTEENLKEIGEPNEYLYWGKHFAYVWSVASDVQYPIWNDSDEEDAELSSDYKDMMTDLNFIKDSFALAEIQQKADADTNTKKTSYNLRSEKTSDVSNEKNIEIKSSIVSDEEYSGFAHLEIENINSEEMQNELNKQGITKATSNSGDLSSNYIVGEYSYKNDLKDTLENITSDDNGNISVYFDVNTDNLVGISFYDAETKNDVGSYEILANNKNAYTFLGFDPDKEYVIDIQGKTQGTWKVEGEYIIY